MGTMTLLQNIISIENYGFLFFSFVFPVAGSLFSIVLWALQLNYWFQRRLFYFTEFCHNCEGLSVLIMALVLSKYYIQRFLVFLNEVFARKITGTYLEGLFDLAPHSGNRLE